MSSLVFSVASYTMLFVRHSPSKGHCVLFLQLQERSFVGVGALLFFSRFILCLVIIDLTFAIGRVQTWVAVLLHISHSLVIGP